MKRSHIVWITAALVALALLLFEVEFRFEFALPDSVTVPDPDVEAAYEACFAARDEDIHRSAFSTIDNPDVQKEYITSNRARAERECRARHPRAEIEREQPFRFNLVDLSPRFW